jgi:hypothetical protein
MMAQSLKDWLIASMITGVCTGFAFAQSNPAATSAAPIPFEGKLEVNAINPEDLLDYNRTVIIPTVYVTLLTGGRQTAVRQSGLLSSGNATARASMNFSVQGVDAALAQSLAEQAYADVVMRMKAAGYTVLTWNDVKSRDVFQSMSREPQNLVTKSENNMNWLTAAPSAEQHFKIGFTGVFAEMTSGGKSKFMDATVIVPSYTVVAPQTWSEASQGYKSVSAEVNIAPGMNLQHAGAPWMGAPKSRIMRGGPGVWLKANTINISTNVGEAIKTADTTPQTANVVAGVLSMLSGVGNIQRSSSEYSFKVQPAAYLAGAMAGISRFNAELAKVAQEAKP